MADSKVTAFADCIDYGVYIAMNEIQKWSGGFFVVIGI